MYWVFVFGYEARGGMNDFAGMIDDPADAESTIQTYLASNDYEGGCDFVHVVNAQTAQLVKTGRPHVHYGGAVTVHWDETPQRRTRF